MDLDSLYTDEFHNKKSKLDKLSRIRRIIQVPLIIFILITINNLNLAKKSHIQIDEIYSLTRIHNSCIYKKAHFNLIQEDKIYKADELLKLIEYQPLNRIKERLGLKKQSIDYIGYKSITTFADLISNLKVYLNETDFFIRNINQLSNHPPLNTIINKLPQILGYKTSIYSMRLVSCLFLLLSSLIIFGISKSIQMNTRSSLIASTIFYSFSLNSLTACFAKGYALEIFLICLSFLCFLRLRQNRDSKMAIVCILTANLAVLCNYMSALFIISGIGTLLIFDFTNHLYKNHQKKQNINWFSQEFYSTSTFILIIYSLSSYLDMYHTQEYMTSSYFDGFQGFMWEFNYVLKHIMGIFTNNLSRLPKIIILITLLIVFILKANEKLRYKRTHQVTGYLLITLLAVSILMVALLDIFMQSHMLSTIRYSLTSIVFLALFLAYISKNIKYLQNLLIILLSASTLFAFRNPKKYLKINALNTPIETNEEYELRVNKIEKNTHKGISNKIDGSFMPKTIIILMKLQMRKDDISNILVES